MAGKFHHEAIYRTQESIARIGTLRVALCGVGAVGSNLADNLVRQGFSKLRAIDQDRIEEHNVGTQLYGESEIGLWKVEALRTRLFRAAGVEIEPVRKEMTDQNAQSLLKDVDLVIDSFDNSASRRLVQETVRAMKAPCLHVGLHADYCEVVWDEQYRVPNDVAGDVCDYPLARNLVLLAVAIASESTIRFAIDRQRESWSATLRDFAVRAMEPPQSEG